MTRDPEEDAILRKVEDILSRHADESGDYYDEEGQAIANLLHRYQAEKSFREEMRKLYETVIDQRNAWMERAKRAEATP